MGTAGHAVRRNYNKESIGGRFARFSRLNREPPSTYGGRSRKSRGRPAIKNSTRDSLLPRAQFSSFLFRGFFFLCAPRDQEQRRITGCNKHTDIIIRAPDKAGVPSSNETVRLCNLRSKSLFFFPLESSFPWTSRNLIIETYRRYCSLLFVE